ncbi:uncharacterized protein LOC105766539 isoform X1 [Gossypium raimondii]|uniref:uncharacterized protein LOC105766539 isoform X1 n=1 Tax=Gossypium raimondii TaxID=29730 RepID=UPI00227D6741|nr:uncharacterized protein LOC105766539 isoform X1 [Gossypium raimondii]XP_052486228.1 uncharacterized protein LOC105766539 isoform X1 [Gossypium raimondii]XP_052486229.1 uncharacterized protein LOC105766539 isoform X1 [Gossypium raimondii]XP_052486230.1 uncharacterized protein LOC105766539 isoform X1 [Gossypium raimondii]XP_052486231.1 uncharacterized protein LOC105766539 isoform X1 [Gossypium raimondii]XP_052486232.1 uncharacterized protein LOC105766539 isoform X1 [Gossypium raimondii]
MPWFGIQMPYVVAYCIMFLQLAMLVFGNHGSLNLLGMLKSEAEKVFNQDMFFKKTFKYVGEPMTHLESIASSALKKSLSSVQINGGETLNVQHNKSSASVQINGGETINVGVEVANSEVEYIESENLSDLEDVDTCLKKLLPGLDFKDWILVVETLNNVRRLSVFHKERMHSMLGDLIPLVVKSLKNPRYASL